MKYLLLSALLISLSACASANIETPDCKASYRSLFRSSSEIDMSACGAKGGATETKSDLPEIIGQAIIESLRVE